ncbi:MFS transporter [Alteribacillus sp. JSM 102045]|uniref:MFS transporter n=1 Tax=Alteribacillus sp. JSM 102045 TaxID=1562101 RepID=UPI0035C1A894
MSLSQTVHHTKDRELDELTKKRLLRLLSLILIFAVMNGTMFNVAIPDIQSHFGLSSSEVSWVLTGYIMVYAVGALIYGKLADYYPIKSILTFGIILFSLGALLGFFSPNFFTLIIARILQAAGGATIPALGFIIPARFFPKERGKVFGVISSTVAFASGVGPIVGGTVGGWLDWRFLFLFSVASLIALPFFRQWVPEEERKEGTIDFLGAGLFSAATASLLLFVTTLLPWFLLSFAVLCVLFIWRTMKVSDPFIRPDMLKNKYYTVTILTSFLGTSVLFGLLFVIPIMMRQLYDMSTLGIGLVLFPGAISAGFLGRLGGELVDRRGGEFVVVLALCLVGGGSFLISTFAGYAPWVVSLALLVAYIGFPLIQSSTANLLSSILSPRETGVGIGIFNLLNFMAGAVSSAVFGAVLESQRVSLSMNPFSRHGDNLIFSNLYICLGLVAAAALTLFLATFKKRPGAFHQPASKPSEVH